MTHTEISIFLAGDAMIARPWSHVRDAAFVGLIDKIREADVAIANLETVIHEFTGYAQADSGGVYMTAPPRIAAELKWAGFDMLAHANNHAFDYGTDGVLETIKHVQSEGLIIAGSGKDLQAARAPRYFRRDEGTVALVATASDFVPYGKASVSRPELHGRPGVNYLTAIPQRRKIIIPLTMGKRLAALVGFPKLSTDPWSLEVALAAGRRGAVADINANLEAISEAASNAGIVVASIHAHKQGEWLQAFARQAIDRGASVVFVHGPHKIRGIELYGGCPIFYSMGDFVFEAEYVTRLPAEAYERLGLAADAAVEELTALREEHLFGLADSRVAFESFVALITFLNTQMSQIRLLPIDLNFDSKDERRGRPQLASPGLGRRIINTVEKKSARFGTRVHYDAVNNVGEVILM